MEETKVEQPAAPVVADTKVETTEQVDIEIKAKEEQKANLDRAIAEANETLRITREETRKAKEGQQEEDLPKIDDNDPNAKAWDKRIKDNVAPVSQALEQEKQEVFDFSLRKFLADRPALAKNPEKLKEVMSTYERVKSSTGRTQEGVLLDLGKAYGAVFYDTDIESARRARLEQAQEEMVAADIGISRGSNSETVKPATKRILSAEERKIIEQWEATGAPKID